jgi:hypothetical protein
MSKNNNKYEKLNIGYGTKYNLDPRSVGHIRSAAISEKKSKLELIEVLKDKIAKNEKTIADIAERNQRYVTAKVWLENATDAEFADLTAPNPVPVVKEEHGTA